MTERVFKEGLSRPPRRRWPLWIGVFSAAIVGLLFFVGGNQSGPKYDEVFTGVSKPAFEGELTTYRYPDHDFQIDIPANWRKMTREEVASAGGTFSEVDNSYNIVDFTSALADEPIELRFNIFTNRTQQTDALAIVSQFQSAASETLFMRLLMRFLNFEINYLTEPTPVDLAGLSVAETTAFMPFSNGNLASIYRVYIVGSDTIEIFVTWEDTGIHPSAFSPILDSFRKM